jgi:hypothetical protein
MEQMKKIFYICLILLAGTNVKAQETKSANGLKLTTQNNELFMEWQDKTATDDTQWVVQASENGKDYNAIGYVWGADPQEKGTYRFKQKLNKISKAVKYFQVWKMENDYMVLAVEAKSLSK